jgi:ubiquinone/menaquinone biosynthesis C-methylase UbiE
METKSTPTRGRTLDHAAFIYDFFEPILMLGKQNEYDRHIVSLLKLSPAERVLDLGCGTGVLTRMIADQLNAEVGGVSLGIDAAAKMINVARKKRESETCRFEVAAAEDLPFENASFDAVVSSLFFHHVPLDLKEKSLLETFRVLRPQGRLVIADMHSPTTWMGALVSHVSRWFFWQPQIGENIRGVLPTLVEKAGFDPPKHVCTYFGYIAIFTSHKPIQLK